MNTITTTHQLAFDFSTAPALATLPAAPPVLEADDRTPSQRRRDNALATLAAGLEDVRTDPKVLEGYLAFCARFRDYSARNKLLVYLQHPQAQFCKGYRDWLKNGRQVRKGERALSILAPLLRRPTEAEIAAGAAADCRVPYGFRAVPVFDYAQTEAVTDDALEYVPPVPRLEAEGPDGLVTALEAAVAAIGYTVDTTDTGYADGVCRFASMTIEVRAGLSSADRAAVLCHELAHAIAHGPDVKKRPSRAAAELQAEGASFVALAALGLDTTRASLPYLKGWAGSDEEALADEFRMIDQIVSRLLSLIGSVKS